LRRAWFWGWGRGFACDPSPCAPRSLCGDLVCGIFGAYIDKERDVGIQKAGEFFRGQAALLAKAEKSGKREGIFCELQDDFGDADLRSFREREIEVDGKIFARRVADRANNKAA